MDMTGFMPHGHCILWSPTLLSLHVATDAIIALSYFSIPLAIVYFVKKKRVKERLVPMLFTAFILTCGMTHIYTIWNWWNTDYWASGMVKLACAAVSATTAILLWFLMPQALKVPTADELESVNKELKDLNEELEKRVAERTESLEQANKKLEEIGKNKTDFFSSVAHEIKNNLNAISLSSEVLDLKQISDSDRGKMNTSIRTNARALNTIINDLLDLGQMEAGKFNIYKESFALEEFVQELEDDFGARAQKKGLEFQVIDFQKLPQAIYSDRVRIRQVLVNLLSNAIKYTSNGKVTLVCDCLSVGEREVLLKFTVEDTGSGIPKEEVVNIFDLFSRSSKHSKVEGLGVGLALSKQIAGLLDGSVVLNHTSDKGSSFTFEFKAKRAET